MPEIQGLAEIDVLMRRSSGQGNDVEFPTSRSYWQILKANAFTFINNVLFAIGIVLIALGRPGDAVVTAGLVLLNVVVGVIQEGRAKRKLDQIALLARPRISVIRDGKEKTVDPGELVLGDAIVVRPGDQLVVDGVIGGDGRLEVDESLLTGESDLVAKRPGDTVYSGSFCVTGTAIYEATKVGADSFANKMTARARDFRMTLTPLQRDVNFVIRLLVIIATILGALLAIEAIRKGVPMVESVQVSAVIVALVPQGLFFMVTVAYALGTLRMAGSGALIQKANAVESMSNVNLLCLDKTGTLTSNRIKLHEVAPLGVERDELLRLLGIYAASASTGNRTSAALAEASPSAPLPVADEIPFSSARQWSALAFDQPDQDGLRGVYALGAPEILHPYLSPDGVDPLMFDSGWEEAGYRVLLFAHTPETRRLHDEQETPLLPQGLIPLGLVSLSDEIRPEAPTTLQGFAKAGIEIKILSGDSPQTVAALAKQAGLPGQPRVIAGQELARMDESQIVQAALDGTIFGRITPYQKEELVRVLQRQGYYVAMIGDGVNDVLSLKQAEIGIAMNSGSPATRSVADIVLLNDSFDVLPGAFQEGQRILNSMLDVIRLFLARTFTVTLLIFAAAVVDLPFPFTPKHNSVLALLTVGIPPLLLTTWARPGKPQRGVIRAVAHFVFPAAFTEAAVGLAIYVFYFETLGDVSLSRTVLTVTTTLMGIVLIIFAEPPTPLWVGGDELSGDIRPARLALVMLGLFAVIMAAPGLRSFFELDALRPQDVAAIGLALAVWIGALRLIWLGRLFERALGVDLR